MDKLLADDGSNPTIETVDEDDGNENKDDDDDTEPAGSETDDGTVSKSTATRRSTRATTQPDRLQAMMFKGKSYLQAKKKVTFADDQTEQLEYCHNLIAQVHPNIEEDYKYNVINTMLNVWQNDKVTIEGASFTQQYLLHKGLKVFGE